MLQKLTQGLIDAKEALRAKRDLEGSLTRARRSLSKQRQRLQELEARLAEESADVKALEELSLRALFHTILGSKQDQLEKERQEVLAAKLRHDECREAIRALAQEVADLEQQLAQLGDVEARYRSLLERKEHVLLQQSNRDDAEELVRLSEAQADARSDLRELQEAVSAGRAVLHSLDNVIAALRGAKDWGAVDLLGGGMVTTAVKHGRVDEARRWTHQTQQHLRRFRRELADLEPDIALGVDIGPFETFADYVFDGLIIDWMVQTSINTSLDRATEMRRRVQGAVAALQSEQEQVQRRAERIQKERRDLIERA